jgi:hypothetical protein
MTASQRGGEPLQLDGGKLGKLAFEWSGDRYQHCWYFDGDSKPQLASLESDGAAVWPDSPPLQQIHQQSFGDGRDIIFGVGMAGRGHWSASFTLVPELKCWIVELACRAPLQPESLTSRYEIRGDWTTLKDNHFESATPERTLQIEAISPSSIASVDGSRLSIAPTEIKSSDTTAATTQWAFRLRVL